MGKDTKLKNASTPSLPEETKKHKYALAPHAASVLMKLLYAARIAQFDLLRSINSLARNVTKWTVDDDAKLYHLMCYVNSSLTKRMTGWVGDKFKDLSYLCSLMRILQGVHNH